MNVTNVNNAMQFVCSILWLSMTVCVCVHVCHVKATCVTNQHRRVIFFFFTHFTLTYSDCLKHCSVPSHEFCILEVQRTTRQKKKHAHKKIHITSPKSDCIPNFCAYVFFFFTMANFILTDQNKPVL